MAKKKPTGTNKGTVSATVQRGSGKVTQKVALPTPVPTQKQITQQRIKAGVNPTMAGKVAPGGTGTKAQNKASEQRTQRSNAKVLKTVVSDRKDAAPQNAGQWLINLLSTGAYAMGEVGQETNGLSLQSQNKFGRGDIGGGFQDLGKAAVGAAKGIGIGVAEGAGFRPEHRAPVTVSSLLNGEHLDTGVTDPETQRQIAKIEKGGGALGQLNAPKGVKVGLGLAADIATDPSTYVSLGATGAVKGAAKGAAQAARDVSAAGRDGQPVLKALAKGAGKTVAGAAKGGKEGFIRQNFTEPALRAEASKARRLYKQEAKAAARAGARGEQPLADAAVDAAREAPVAAPAAAVERATEDAPTPAAAPDAVEAAVDQAAPTAARTVTPEERGLAEATSDAVERAVQTIDGPLGRVEVPAEKILQDAAAGQGAPGLITAEHVTALQDAAKASPKELDKTIKALSADPQMKSFLDKTVPLPQELQIAGSAKTMKVSALIQRIALQSATGGSNKLPGYQRLLQGALQAGSKMQRRATPESLGDAIAINLPTLGDTVDPASLFKAISMARTPEERAQVLREALAHEAPGKYDTVEQALDAAVGSDMRRVDMQKIMKALGLKGSNTSTESLRNILGTEGRKTWQEINDTLQTPVEVLAVHGVDEMAADVAKDLDVQPHLEEAAKAVERLVEDTPDLEGVNPLSIGPATGSATGNAIYDGAQALGRLLRGPGKTEAFDNDTWKDVWSTVVSRVAKRRGFEKLNHTDPLRRSDLVMDTTMKAMRVLEDHQRSLGIFARIADRRADLGAPLFVGPAQIMQALDRETLRKVMFPVKIRYTDVTKGITMYPTTLANVVRKAIQGERAGLDRDDALEAAREWLGPELKKDARVKGGSDFLISKQGQEAVDDLFRHLREGNALDEVHRLHDLQQPVAVALANRATDDIVRPLAAQITEASARGADAGEMDEILQAAFDADRGARTSTDGANLVSDQVRQRINEGVVKGILGQDGFRVAREARRAASRTNRSQAQQAAAVDASEAARAAGHPGPVREVARATRNRAADDTVRTLEDLDDQVASRIDQDIADGYLESTDELARLESAAAMMLDDPGVVRFSKSFAQRFSGPGLFGREMQAMRIAEDNTSHLASQHFTEKITKWIDGKDGILIRLQRDLHMNAKPSRADLNAKMSSWIRALAEGTEDTLPGAEAAMAREMKGLLDEFMHPSAGGPLARSGVASSDLVQEMTRRGWGRDDALRPFMPNPGEPLADQAHLWKAFADSENIPSLMSNWYAALAASQVKPAIGASLSRIFDHRSFGLTMAEAKAQGWKRLDTFDDSADLARHVRPDSYFPPETIKRMGYLQDVMRISDNFTGEQAKQLVGAYDLILRVFKSAATVWRPGHHVTNILGEVGINAVAGVSPMNYIRAIKVMRAGGDAFMDADLSVLGRTDEIFGSAVSAQMKGDTVLVTINGKAQPLDMRTVRAYAQRSGVSQSHSAAMDLLDGAEHSFAPKGIKRFTQSKLNVVARTDENLGRFSAMRDNVTRIGHYISELEKKNYRSLDDALNSSAAVVHDWHPTVSTLAPLERKYARRIFYFYTWMRQAASRVVRLAADRPGMVTIPSKLQYNQAQANGLEPESIGQVNNGDPRLPSYNTTGILGPTFEAGGVPTEDAASMQMRILQSAGAEKYGSVDAAIDAAVNGQMTDSEMKALLAGLGQDHDFSTSKTLRDHLDNQGRSYWAKNSNGNLWGYSLSQPQMDTLSTLFSGATWSPDKSLADNVSSLGTSTAQNLFGSSFAPGLQAVPELMTGHQIGGGNGALGTGPNGQVTSQDLKKYVFDNLGAPSQLARLTPAYNDPAQQKQANDESLYQKWFPSTSDPYKSADENQGDQMRAWLNYLTGLKFTNYTNSTSQYVAQQEADAKKKAAGSAKK